MGRLQVPWATAALAAKASRLLQTVLVPCQALLALVSCQGLLVPQEQGTITVHFAEEDYYLTRSTDIPDTSDFILSITSDGGKTIYSGKYGDSPSEIKVDPGTYLVSARSGEFKAPAFSSPIYGDDQYVVVTSGGISEVKLICSQKNSGIRLKIASSFLENCPDGVLYVKSDDGKLMYSYTEKRIAYFNPGNVSVVMTDKKSTQTLLTKSLESKEILSVGIAASKGYSSTGVTIAIDTTRNWTSDDYVIGGDSGGGSTKTTAINVTKARESIGKTGVWVYGYITGCFKTTGKLTSAAPFTANTNVAIGPRSSSGVDSCISVELKKGNLRTAINLVDHPGNIGKKLWIKGDIVESYYGIPGIKNVTEYELK